MGLQELTPFLRETITHVHDLAVLRTAWHAAGHFGEDDPIRRRFAELGKTEADRRALAELMFACVSSAIHGAMWFVEERNTMGQIEVTVSDGSKPYTLHGTDMVTGWFESVLEEHSTESTETLLQEIERVAVGGKIRVPSTQSFRRSAQPNDPPLERTAIGGQLKGTGQLRGTGPFIFEMGS